MNHRRNPGFGGIGRAGVFLGRRPVCLYGGVPFAAARKPTRRVVFVLIDALRADTAQNAEVMPTLASPRDQGASATGHSRQPGGLQHKARFHHAAEMEVV